MQAPFSLFLALRYLQPKRSFVSVITVISILGVVLGVVVLVVVISVMTGFDHELRRKVLGFDANVLVTTDGVLHDWRKLDERLQKVPHVVATAPYVQGPVIVEFEGRRLAPKIRGIDPEREQRVTDISGAVKEGKLDLATDEQGNSNKTILGRELANALGVRVGDSVVVYSPRDLTHFVDELNRAKETKDTAALDDLKEMVLPTELTVTGIFDSGRFAYDAEFMLVPLHVAQELYGLKDDLHGLTLKLDDPYLSEQVKADLLGTLEPGIEVITWIDLNRSYFDAIGMERAVMFFVLMVVVVVAAFGIMTTMITVTIQKRREIGVMKALGANAAQIVWVFLLQGMVVAVLGNALGVGVGMALIRWRNEVKTFLAAVLHVEIFPASIYQFTQIPAEVVPSDVTIIVVSAFGICSLAALLPAYLAARLDPVKALRYE